MHFVFVRPYPRISDLKLTIEQIRNLTDQIRVIRYAHSSPTPPTQVTIESSYDFCFMRFSRNSWPKLVSMHQPSAVCLSSECGLTCNLEITYAAIKIIMVLFKLYYFYLHNHILLNMRHIHSHNPFVTSKHIPTDCVTSHRSTLEFHTGDAAPLKDLIWSVANSDHSPNTIGFIRTKTSIYHFSYSTVVW